MGDDVRWVGNESGMGRETEWSATVLTPKAYAQADDNNGRLGITNLSKDLGSRNMIEKATEMFWYPSEVDVSIRPGWFHTADQDEKVKVSRHWWTYISSQLAATLCCCSMFPRTKEDIFTKQTR